MSSTVSTLIHLDRTSSNGRVSACRTSIRLRFETEGATRSGEADSDQHDDPRAPETHADVEVERTP
jgi:hypothetical protein